MDRRPTSSVRREVHTANQTLEKLRKTFRDQIISFKTPHIWAPHSPDLNPPDFYLWGYLKDRVYANRPLELDDLKNAIERETAAIPIDQCVRVIDNFARRTQACLEQAGGHLEHIIRAPRA